MSETRNGRTGSSVYLASFALLFGMWLLSSGHYTAMIISFGVASCAGVVALGARMRIIDRESVPIHMIGRALRYMPFFLIEVLKANVDVAKRVLSPSLPVSPTVIVIHPTQKSDLGRVLYANSITATPGTVTIEAEGGAITVHAIAREVAEELERGVMDFHVTRMEGRS